MSCAKNIFAQYLATGQSAIQDAGKSSFLIDFPPELRIHVYGELIANTTKREHGDILLIDKRLGAEMFGRLKHFKGEPPRVVIDHRTCDRVIEVYGENDGMTAFADLATAADFASYVQRYGKVEVAIANACVCLWAGKNRDDFMSGKLFLREEGYEIMKIIHDA